MTKEQKIDTLINDIKNAKEKANYYMELANQKWRQLTKDFYMCYTVGELANDTIYKLFNKNILYEIPAYYKKNTRLFKKVNGVDTKTTFKILCELENNLFFQFDIYWATGVFGDTGLHIDNGKFRIMKGIPKGWKNIEELFNNEEE